VTYVGRKQKVRSYGLVLGAKRKISSVGGKAREIEISEVAAQHNRQIRDLK